MQAGAGHLADGVQAGQVGATAGIGHDAAAGVVGRRDDRDRLARDVDAELEAAGVDVGEVALQEVRALVADVELDTVEAALLHFEVDGARHDVARRELSAGIVLRHEPRTVRQLEQSAFAAHRLADEKRLGVRVIQARRVELDELHVRDAATRAPAHRDAVAARGVRIGRVQVDLARAAGGEHRVPGADGDHVVGLAVERVQPEATRFVETRSCAM